jgi:hypothetical protein
MYMKLILTQRTDKSYNNQTTHFAYNVTLNMPTGKDVSKRHLMFNFINSETG